MEVEVLRGLPLPVFRLAAQTVFAGLGVGECAQVVYEPVLHSKMRKACHRWGKRLQAQFRIERVGDYTRVWRVA